MDVIRNGHSFTLNHPSLSLVNKKPISIRQLKTPFISLQTNPFPKLSAYKNSTTHQVSSFTVDYLVRSTSASLKIHLDSPEKPNSVLTLLRKRGFTKTQISKLVKKRPFLLLAHPHNTLLPKLQFFYSIEVSNSDLATVLTSDPTVLTRSLDNQIIPAYNYLKTILFTNEKIVSALKRTTWIFLEDHSKNLGPMGVPHSCISLLLTHFPEAMMQRHDELGKIVKEMEFDPKKSTFVLAVHAISGKGNKSIWNKCFEVYSRWGWSKDDIFAAFNKHPHCMMLSEKKTMDFFVNRMGLNPKTIADCPVVLFLSLEKRIIPSLATILIRVEQFFLERFVTKFEEQVPQLLSVYEGTIDPEEL